MRTNLPKVGDMPLLVACCLLLTSIGFYVDARQRKQQRLRRRAAQGEQQTLADINFNLALEQRLREERRL